MSEKFHLIKDQLHLDVPLNETEWQIIHTKVFRRLHHIRVLGPGFLVFPSATNSVFEHAIGTLKLAADISQKTEECNNPMLRLCALLHEIGESPFGLSMTEVAEKYGWAKEKRAIEVIRHSPEIDRILGKTKKQNLIEKMKEAFYSRDSLFHKILFLSNPPIGANVLDFILRDQAFVGWISGTIDIKRFTTELKWNDHQPDVSEIKDIISIISVALQTYYDKIYYFKPKRIADLMLIRITETILDNNYVDKALFPFKISSVSDLESFLSFTDEKVFHTIEMVSEKNREIQEASSLLRTGRLLDTFDLSSYFYRIFPMLENRREEDYIDDPKLKKELDQRLRGIEKRICDDCKLSPLKFYLDSPVIYRVRIFAMEPAKIRQKLFPTIFCHKKQIRRVSAYLPKESLEEVSWENYF